MLQWLFMMWWVSGILLYVSRNVDVVVQLHGLCYTLQLLPHGYGWSIYSIYVFIGIFFRQSVWKACFPILLAQGETPASGFMHPSRWLPSSRKNRVTRLCTWIKRGGIWTDASVCLHNWVVIWVAEESNFHLYCTVYGCVIDRIHYGLKVVFGFRHFTTSHYLHYTRLPTGTECI